MPQLPNDHPLLQRSELNSPRNLAAWLKEWRQATHYVHLNALLYHGYSPEFHVGATQRDYEQERLRFYLAIADGFNLKLTAFAIPAADSTISERALEVALRRKQLAEKAFTILAQKVFKNTERPIYSNSPSWLSLVGDSATFEAVLHFLRIDPETQSIVNLPPLNRNTRSDQDKRRLHHLETLRQFTLDLIRLGFKGAIKPTYSQYEVEAAFPQFIVLLVRLGEAQRLEDRVAYPFNNDCWATLKRLALEPVMVETDSHRPQEVVPRSIEEAMALGSEAARVFHLRSLYQQHDVKQANIKEAERQRAEADAQLQRLSD